MLNKLSVSYANAYATAYATAYANAYAKATAQQFVYMIMIALTTAIVIIKAIKLFNSQSNSQSKKTQPKYNKNAVVVYKKVMNELENKIQKTADHLEEKMLHNILITKEAKIQLERLNRVHIELMQESNALNDKTNRLQAMLDDIVNTKAQPNENGANPNNRAVVVVAIPKKFVDMNKLYQRIGIDKKNIIIEKRRPKPNAKYID